MLGLGPREIIILAAVLVLLFGAKKIPELARGIGQAGKELRKGFSDDESDSGDSDKEKENDTTDKKDN